MGIVHVKDASLVNRCGAEPISMRNRTDLGEGEEAGVSLPFVPPLPGDSVRALCDRHSGGPADASPATIRNLTTLTPRARGPRSTSRTARR